MTVSSFNNGLPGTNAVDGSLTTYWRSLKGSSLSSEWIVVDLGSATSISQVQLEWNSINRYATAYTIQVSSDNVNWTTVSTNTLTNTTYSFIDTNSVGTMRFFRAVPLP